MKRVLLKQMLGEWRGNLWIVVGLTIVSLAIWILGSQLYGILLPTFYPMGFEDERLYVMTINDAPKAADDSQTDNGDETADKNEDIRTLLKEYRNNENVEVAGLSRDCTPYERSWGTYLYLAEENDTVGYRAYTKLYTPEMVRVMGLKSATGKSTEDLEEILRKGDVLITTLPGKEDEIREAGGFLPEYMAGKKVKDDPDGEPKYKVGDVVEVMRDSKFNRSFGTLIVPISESNPMLVSEIAVRVKPGREDAFIADFESKPEMQGIRSVYLGAPQKVTYSRMAAEQADKVSSRLYVALICFIFVIIFLGLLGTFWFRVQQRIGEIAIRKVCGASNGDIFRRIIGEGLILLLFATALTGIIAWAIILKADIETDRQEAAVIEALAFVIVAASIVIALWWPARRAMRIEPAVAVKDE